MVKLVDLLADNPAPLGGASQARPPVVDLLADEPPPPSEPGPGYGMGGGFDVGALVGPDPAKQARAARLRAALKTQMDRTGRTPGSDDLFNDGFTLGAMKPTAGLAEALGGKVRQWAGVGEPQTLAEGYAAGEGAYQDRLDEARANSGWDGTAAGFVGSVLGGGPAGAAKGLWPVVKQAATLGGIEGAARHSEDLPSAVKGGIESGLTSAATAGTIGTVLKVPGWGSRRAAARAAAQGTAPEALKDEARALYKQLENANIAYDTRQAGQLVNDTMSDLRQNKWSPTGVHAQLNGIIQQIQDLPQGGRPMSLETLQGLREQITSEAGSNEPQIRRIAGRLLGSIDAFVTHVDPAMSSIPREQVAPLWGQARRLWRAANTAEDIGWRVGKAEMRAASTNSGQNAENAIRQNIRGVYDKAAAPRTYNPYNPAEMAQMRRVVEGSRTQNVLRSTGNFLTGIPASTITGLTGAGAAAAGLGHGIDLGTSLLAGGAGLAATGAVQGAGRMVKAKAANMARDEADNLMRLITTGSMEQLPYAGPPTREALAAIMAKQQAARGAGVFMGDQ
jgi:hypothetical protein